MADGFVQLPVDSTGKKLQTVSNTVGADTVHSQGIFVTDSAGNIVDVATSDPAGTERGVITRNIPSGTQDVTQPNASATGTINALNGSVQIATGGYGSVVLTVTGTWTATLAFQGSNDGGTTWAAISGDTLLGGPGSSLTANGTRRIPVGGLTHFRVTATAFTSGVPNVTLTVGQAVSTIGLSASLPTGPNTIGNIGNALATPAGVRLSDGSAALVGQKVMSSSLPVVVASDQTLVADTELPAARTPADSLALVSCPDTGGPNYLYNGSTMDLERNDLEVSLRASAIHNPGAENGPDTTAHNAESLLLIVNVTIVAANGALTVAVQGKDQLSSAYYTYWTAELPIKQTGTYAYFFANGASGGDFTECQAFGLAPRVWRYQTTVATAAVTYSVACVMGDN